MRPKGLEKTTTKPLKEDKQWGQKDQKPKTRKREIQEKRKIKANGKKRAQRSEKRHNRKRLRTTLKGKR